MPLQRLVLQPPAQLSENKVLAKSLAYTMAIHSSPSAQRRFKDILLWLLAAIFLAAMIYVAVLGLVVVAGCALLLMAIVSIAIRRAHGKPSKDNNTPRNSM